MRLSSSSQQAFKRLFQTQARLQTSPLLFPTYLLSLFPLCILLPYFVLNNRVFIIRPLSCRFLPPFFVLLVLLCFLYDGCQSKQDCV